MLEGYQVKFQDVKMKTFEYFFTVEGGIHEDDIRDFIRTQFKHERLDFWVQLSLSVLKSDLLIESYGEFHSKVWKLVDPCVKIEDEN